MRYVFICYIVFSTILTGCIEQLDTVEPKFEKYYGRELSSYPSGLLRLENGEIIIFGETERTIISSGDDPLQNISKNVNVPTIFKIDEFGNVNLERYFPILNVNYKVGRGARSYDIEKASFANFLELPNGNYMGVWFSYFPQYHYGTMIFNEDFELLKVNLFGDSTEELIDGFDVDRYYENTSFISSSNEVFLLSEFNFITDVDQIPITGAVFYSITKVSLDGELMEVYDFALNSFFSIGVEMDEFNPNSAIMLVEEDFRIMLQLVNSNTGSVEDQVLVEEGALSDGRMIFKEDKVLLASSVFGQPPSISIYSSDLIELEKVEYQIPEGSGNICVTIDFIELKENGGYCVAFETCEGLISIFRLSENLDVIWEKYIEHSTSDGSRFPSGLMETEDGGILFIRTKQFNSSSPKIYLEKFQDKSSSHEKD